jgi:DNA-binding transcriptional LysR family regulator
VQGHHLFSHDLLQALVAIADTGSFAKAGEQLHVTQSAVSLQIRRLETQAGQMLFEKMGRQMLPNSAGRVLIEYARRMLALNLEASHALQGRMVDGLLRLGAPQDIAEDHLPDVLKHFSALYPRMRLEVRVERNQQLIKSIERGEYDVAMTLSETPLQRPASEHFELRTLGQTKMSWLASDLFYQRVRGSISEPLPLVLLEPPCLFRSQAIAALEAKNIAYRVAFTTASLAGLRAAVQAGLGVTARMAAAQDKERGITEYGRGPDRTLWVLPKLGSLKTHLYFSSDPATPATRSLAELLERSVVGSAF